MSHIPNSAMPHAAPSHEPEVAEANQSLASRARKVADEARAHPKTAIAAGAAVVAGAIAAVAIPIVQSRRSAESKPAAKKKPAAKAAKS